MDIDALLGDLENQTECSNSPPQQNHTSKVNGHGSTSNGELVTENGDELHKIYTIHSS